MSSEEQYFISSPETHDNAGQDIKLAHKQQKNIRRHQRDWETIKQPFNCCKYVFAETTEAEVKQEKEK
jgi:hypothetical protein